jgi:hypothetical protein
MASPTSLTLSKRLVIKKGDKQPALSPLQLYKRNCGPIGTNNKAF